MFGTAAFKIYKQRNDKTIGQLLSDLSTGEVDAITDLLCAALIIGEKHQKLPHDNFNEVDVAIWVDEYPGGALAFMQVIADAMPKADAGEGEAAGEAKTPATPETGTSTN